jgi:predicted nuclease of restriction endonuclease-like (RecB) superfamily
LTGPSIIDFSLALILDVSSATVALTQSKEGDMAKRKQSHNPVPATKAGPLAETPVRLLDDLRSLIRQTREGVAQAVNSALVLLYWQVGHRIRTEILNKKRAGYGEEIPSTLSKELTADFGKGYSWPNLSRMVRLAELFADREVVVSLSRQLSWSHFVEIIPLDDGLKRDSYAEMCRVERWSVRTLRAKVQGMLFERTALSRKPAELARKELAALREQDTLTPDMVFRDPYFLDFLGLADTYSEKQLEVAILRELQQFILELGAGFAFIDRQRRIVIDGEDFFIDLLYYHRRLRRLLAIDLKIGKFAAADKGQMELYLRWLEKHEMQPGEEAPLGLILCADKSAEQVELLKLDKSGIRVASYLTELPPRPLLQKKLHQAVLLATARLENPGHSRDD